VTTHDAVILVGGTGRRLGGTSKAQLLVAGRSLLVRAVDLLSAAQRIVVAGATDQAVPPEIAAAVVVTCERPIGGGPVAGLDAALGEVESPVVVVLAVDMPLVRGATVAELVARCADGEAVMLVDADGRRQPLAAAYRTDVLRAAIARLGSAAGQSMRDLVAELAITEISTDPDETLDCDTWDDVARARRILEDS
jgi:molybdopterin-guanine dinucleotide biosynthesis protein A